MYICKGVSHLLCLGTMYKPLLLQTCTKVLLQLFVIPKKYVQKSWKPICMPNSPDDVYDGYYDLQLCPETLIEFEFPSKHFTVGTLRILDSNMKLFIFKIGKNCLKICHFLFMVFSAVNIWVISTIKWVWPSVWVSKNCLHLFVDEEFFYGIPQAWIVTFHYK